MELKRIEHKLTVCKVAEASNINIDAPFYFIGKTGATDRRLAPNKFK